MLVTWQDSNTDRGWIYNREYTAKPTLIETCGFIVSVTDEAVSISTSLDKENHGFVGPITIPWTAIDTIKEVS